MPMHRFLLRFFALLLILCPFRSEAAVPPDGYSEFLKVVPVFQRLYPEYRLSDGTSCTANFQPSSFHQLSFYAVSGKLRRSLPRTVDVILVESRRPNAYALRGYDEPPAIVLSRGLLEHMSAPSEL